MSAPLMWIVGRGLLGSHLAAAMTKAMPEAKEFTTENRLHWDDPAALASQCAQACAAFTTTIAESKADNWVIAWTAGSGVMSTNPQALSRETASLELFLKKLDATAGHALMTKPGVLFLASSAGGLYGHGTDTIITEATPPTPVSAYGHEKLKQERLVAEWAAHYPESRILIGRISNLYGSGQNLAKPQGLIAQMSHRIIRHQPIHIYVPLDTTRDYLHVRDAATMIARTMQTLLDTQPIPQVIVKIVASEQPTTVARIIGTFRHITRTSPRIVVSNRTETSLYQRAQRFASTVLPSPIPPRTDLLTGIAELHRYQLAAYRSGTGRLT